MTLVKLVVVRQTWYILPTDVNYEKIMNKIQEASYKGQAKPQTELRDKGNFYRGILVEKNHETRLFVGVPSIDLQKELMNSAPDDVISSTEKQLISFSIASQEIFENKEDAL